jgi:multicomponent K+:H+ antiporter subunit C
MIGVEAFVALAVGVMVAGGVYLMLRARTFPVIVGLALLSYATNLALFASGGVRIGLSPIYAYGKTDYSDPVPQALVLTAIVIGFAMTAFVLVLALRANFDVGSDHVDGARADGGEGGE